MIGMFLFQEYLGYMQNTFDVDIQIVIEDKFVGSSTTFIKLYFPLCSVFQL